MVGLKHACNIDAVLYIPQIYVKNVLEKNFKNVKTVYYIYEIISIAAD